MSKAKPLETDTIQLFLKSNDPRDIHSPTSFFIDRASDRREVSLKAYREYLMLKLQLNDAVGNSKCLLLSFIAYIRLIEEKINSLNAQGDDLFTSLTQVTSEHLQERLGKQYAPFMLNIEGSAGRSSVLYGFPQSDKGIEVLACVNVEQDKIKEAIGDSYGEIDRIYLYYNKQQEIISYLYLMYYGKYFSYNQTQYRKLLWTVDDEYDVVVYTQTGVANMEFVNQSGHDWEDTTLINECDKLLNSVLKQTKFQAHVEKIYSTINTVSTMLKETDIDYKRIRKYLLDTLEYLTDHGVLKVCAYIGLIVPLKSAVTEEIGQNDFYLMKTNEDQWDLLINRDYCLDMERLYHTFKQNNISVRYVLRFDNLESWVGGVLKLLNMHIT